MVAETILAGYQHRVAGTIRLAVAAGGFATRTLPGEPSLLSVRGADLVVRRGGVDQTHSIQGRVGELADAAGIDFGAPQGVYSDASGASASYRLVIDPTAAAVMAEAFALGDAALRELGARHGPVQQPVLWPEHFDVGISLDEVNYGVSVGDETIPEPYAYVGPWKPRRGDFWDQAFGAARRVAELADAAAVVAFFEAGRLAATSDPPQD